MGNSLKLTYEVVLEESADIRATADSIELVLNAMKGVSTATLTSTFQTGRQPYLEKAYEKATKASPIVMTEASAPRKSEALPSPATRPPAAAINVSRAMGFTGDMCAQCGQFSMRRNGSCLVCMSCGTTTGCS